MLDKVERGEKRERDNQTYHFTLQVYRTNDKTLLSPWSHTPQTAWPSNAYIAQKRVTYCSSLSDLSCKKLRSLHDIKTPPNFSWPMKQDRCQHNFPPVLSFKPCLLTHEQTHRPRGFSCQTCQNNTSFPLLCEAQCGNGQESLHMLLRESRSRSVKQIFHKFYADTKQKSKIIHRSDGTLTCYGNKTFQRRA